MTDWLSRTTMAFAPGWRRRAANLVGRVLEGESIGFLDIGAAEGAPARWAPYRPFVHYFGVEPDARSASSVLERQSSQGFRSQHLVTRALWSQPGEITLNLCRKPTTSSVFVPNRELFDLFSKADRVEVVDTATIPCTTLDLLADEGSIVFDAMKLDIQGAELEVLKGAARALRSTLLIEAEVEFAELYRDQPLFDQVLSHLRQEGFDLIDFLHIHRWSGDGSKGAGQVVFGDALVMRLPESLAVEGVRQDQGAWRRLRVYVALCAVYGRGDLLYRLIRKLRPLAEVPTDWLANAESLAALFSARRARLSAGAALLDRMLGG